MLKIMRECIKDLETMALRPRVTQGGELFKLMIQSEQDEKKPGYMERIASLKRFLSQYEILE
jgi:hypothetical protein